MTDKLNALGGEEHFGRLFTFKFLSALNTEKNKCAKACYPSEKKLLELMESKHQIIGLLAHIIGCMKLY